MVSIDNKKFVYFHRPEFVKRGFLENFFNFFLAFCIERYPHPLGFHTYRVLLNNVFIDKIIDISPVRWDQLHKIVCHFKLYRRLELLHILKRQIRAEKVAQRAKQN